MEAYLEQTVSAPVRAVNRIGKIAAWTLLIVLAIAVIFSLTNVVSVTQEEGLKFNWVALAVLAVSLALGIFVYRTKDKLDTEYDYIISGDVLEVFGVYAAKRRKRLMRVEIPEISACGAQSDASFRSEAAHPGQKKLDFVLNDSADAFYICFRQGTGRVMALLEMNAEMREYISKSVRGNYGAIGGGN